MSNRTAQEILMGLARRWAADDCTDLVLDMLEKVLDLTHEDTLRDNFQADIEEEESKEPE
jgi:hypothetical protein